MNSRHHTEGRRSQENSEIREGQFLGNYMRKCASGGQSLANAERGVGMCGFAGKIDTEFFITNVFYV